MSAGPGLADRVRLTQRRIDQMTGEAKAVAAAGVAARDKVARLTEQVALHEQVTKYLTSLGEAEQQHAQSQIEQLVTRGLQVIFDETLSFHLVQAVRNNQATVDFVVRSEYPCGECAGNPASYPAPGCPCCEQTGKQGMDTPVMDARGGGLAAAVGFMLRLVVVLLTPGIRRVLFLDETFAHVSAEYEPRLAEFLREVADKAGVQIVLITHSKAYDDLADASYELSLGADGATRAVQGGGS